MTHNFYMHNALNLARRGLGRTWPNPTVGCVIVKDGRIIARARTSNSGRPHAETNALCMTKDAAGAIVYITLEPCAHHGKTPPCADSLIGANVKEVVIGCLDPDPRTAGKGVRMLEAAGIKVTTGILENECHELNKGFFRRIENGLPHVMLKVAISADYKYLPGDGTQPRWVTGELARNHVHLLRTQYEVILTGTKTVLDDDPMMNCRLPGMEEYSPIKVLVGKTKVPENANIFRGKECWVYTDKIKTILKELAEKGVTRVMVEAGPLLSGSMLKDGLVNEIIVFKSQHALGKHGLDFFAPKTLDNFKPVEEREFGDDLMIRMKYEG